MKRRQFASLGVRRPGGLVNWRYLWPLAFRDPRVAVHRAMWVAGRGRQSWPLWMARELLGGLRWMSWFGWRSALAAVAARGATVQAAEGISIARQRRIALSLALGWGVAGYELYRFRLYRDPRTALDYVYDCETNAFHTLQSGTSREASEADALLRDKAETFDRLTAIGVPVVPSRMLVLRNAVTPFVQILAAEAVFCKTRSGHGGAGAFSAWPTRESAAGRSFAGPELPDIAAVDEAWRGLLARDDVLVQPMLMDNLDLARLAMGDALTTIRYISRTEGDNVVCLSAVLEISLRKDSAALTRYAILPIDPITGMILPLPEHLDDGWRNIGEEIRARALDITHVPHWYEIAAASELAHRKVSGLWAIAWDWAVTPKGPMLLEGNVSWALAVPQQLIGPALHWRAADDGR